VAVEDEGVIVMCVTAGVEATDKCVVAIAEVVADYDRRHTCNRFDEVKVDMQSGHRRRRCCTGLGVGSDSGEGAPPYVR
jgi:hypothetical protein